MQYEVIDGLRVVAFTGREIASASTQRQMPEGRTWNTLSAFEKKTLSRWVEMELYVVDAGQDDPGDLIRLPGGGYFFHVIGQSLLYHAHNSVCNNGVPVRASETEVDVVPCPDCRPPLLWDWHEPQDPEDAVLLTEPGLEVDVETPRNSLRRAETALGIIRDVEGKQLSTPAQKLLEIAMRNDPEIRKVYAR